MTEKYILVCISHGGKVSSSTYDSRYAADNARSIALTGMTLEEVAERRQFHANERKEWERSHPWRKPETAWERDFVKRGAGSLSMMPGGAWSSKDGMIREDYSGENWSRVMSPSDIIKAVVFKDAGDTSTLDSAA